MGFGDKYCQEIFSFKNEKRKKSMSDEKNQYNRSSVKRVQASLFDPKTFVSFGHKRKSKITIKFKKKKKIIYFSLKTS